MSAILSAEEANNEVLECARYNEPEDLLLLLQQGAHVDHQDKDGNTALHKGAVIYAFALLDFFYHFICVQHLQTEMWTA